MRTIEQIAETISKLIQQIESFSSNSGYELSNQASKLAIQLEYLLEHKADAKRTKYATYAVEYEKQRLTKSQGDAKISADAKRDMTYDRIEAIESGVKSILSTVKDRLHWLELENLNKGF